jgi:thiol-disulfide isomerase/thioredoxin
MRKFWKWTSIVLGGVIGSIALLIGAMWLSEDVRYGVLYAVMERVDLNPAVPPAQLARQVEALHHTTLIDENGRPFDWHKSPHAIIWINAWANWCVPCRMEFAAMAALRERVGGDRLRIVLFSQPKYWEADKRLARQLGLDFELVTAKDPAPQDMAAINLARHPDDFLLPEHSFLRADGAGIEAMKTVRDWDSTEWEAIIRRWQADEAYRQLPR